MCARPLFAYRVFGGTGINGRNMDGTVKPVVAGQSSESWSTATEGVGDSYRASRRRVRSAHKKRDAPCGSDTSGKDLSEGLGREAELKQGDTRVDVLAVRRNLAPVQVE